MDGIVDSAIPSSAAEWLMATGKAWKRESPKCCLERVMLFRLSFFICNQRVLVLTSTVRKWEPQMQAAYVILNVLGAMLNGEKEQVKLILINIFYLIPYI